jgi:hypothetical protein
MAVTEPRGQSGVAPRLLHALGTATSSSSSPEELGAVRLVPLEPPLPPLRRWLLLPPWPSTLPVRSCCCCALSMYL